MYANNNLRKAQWLVGQQTYVDGNGDTQPVIDDDGNQLTLDPVIPSLDASDNGYNGVSNVKYELENTGLTANSKLTQNSGY